MTSRINQIINSIWIEKYRPQTIEDMALNADTLAQIRKFEEEKTIPNLFLCSRPGQGKTSLAKVLAYNVMNADVLYLNASEQNNVDTVRGLIADFARTLPTPGKDFKIIILDEIDGFANVQSQKILRGLMEEAADNTRFILTANYQNKVIEAVRSRCLTLDITPDMKEVIRRCVYILKTENVQGFTKETLPTLCNLVKKLYPDVRSIIKVLQSQVNKDNVLSIKDYSISTEFLTNVVELIMSDSSSKLREYLIDNEGTFNNDYHSMLTELYHFVIANDKVAENLRATWTIQIANALARFQQVIDPEINAAACLFEMQLAANK